jgi:hypothetical protein
VSFLPNARDVDEECEAKKKSTTQRLTVFVPPHSRFAPPFPPRRRYQQVNEVTREMIVRTRNLLEDIEGLGAGADAKARGAARPEGTTN